MTNEDGCGEMGERPRYAGLAILKREGDLGRTGDYIPCNGWGDAFTEDVILWKPRWSERYLAEPISDKARTVFDEFYVAEKIDHLPVPFKRYWFPTVNGRGERQGKIRIRNLIRKHGLSVRAD